MLLGGSTARGHADRYSDIELGVFWHQPPTDAERQAAASAIRGDLVRLYPYDPAEEVWCDDYMLGRAHPDQPKSGVLVEVVHSTTDFLNRTFDAVLQNYNPDALKQNLIAGVVDGVPLHNAELVQHWKARAAMYPEGLALAVVNRYSMIDHFWRWEMWLARGGSLMMLYQAFAQIQQQLLHVLLGLRIPPLLIARMEHDMPGLNVAVDAFVTAAADVHAPVELVNHPDGHHGFDTEDDNEQSRAIIAQTLSFMQRHLGHALPG